MTEAPYNAVIHNPECTEARVVNSAVCPCGPLHLRAATPFQLEQLMRRVAEGILEQLAQILARMQAHQQLEEDRDD